MKRPTVFSRRLRARLPVACAAVFALTAPPLTAAEPRPAPRPNIILMMTDDLGWGDPGETTNLAAQHADVVRSMKAQLGAFRESCKLSLTGKDYAVPFTPDKDDTHPSEPGFARALRAAAVAPAAEQPPNPRAADRRAKRTGRAPAVASAGTAAPSRVARQNDDSGVVTLPAGLASLHGGLTYRADQEKIGQWASVNDWLSWEFEVRQPGKFEVEVSCGHTENGSVYEIVVGGQTLRSTVSASGNHRTPKAQLAGSLTIAQSGRHTLALKPVSRQGPVVISLWKIDLIPVNK